MGASRYSSIARVKKDGEPLFLTNGERAKIRPPMTDEDGEVRELTAEDFKDMRPLREVDPRLVEAFEKKEIIMVESTATPMRPPMRDEDYRATAEERAREILDHIGSMDEGTDEFYFDPAQVPAGWTYEWKRFTVSGQEDPAYQVALSRTGWQAVPVGRHPEMMPVGWTGAILRKGNMLMERPKVITDMVKQRDQKVADDQVKIKEHQITSQPLANMPAGFEATNKGNAMGKIRTSVEPMVIPQ